jgi:hypothetical protein
MLHATYCTSLPYHPSLPRATSYADIVASLGLDDQSPTFGLLLILLLLSFALLTLPVVARIIRTPHLPVFKSPKFRQNERAAKVFGDLSA